MSKRIVKKVDHDLSDALTEQARDLVAGEGVLDGDADAAEVYSARTELADSDDIADVLEDIKAKALNDVSKLKKLEETKKAEAKKAESDKAKADEAAAKLKAETDAKLAETAKRINDLEEMIRAQETEVVGVETPNKSFLVSVEETWDATPMWAKLAGAFGLGMLAHYSMKKR